MSPFDVDGSDATGDRYRDWDAAYVLGSLSPSERHEYEQHLASCPACRDALADLAGMPGLLGTVAPAEAFSMLDRSTAPAGSQAPPPALLAGLVSRARRERLRRRVLATAGGVLAVAAAVALTLVVTFSSTPGSAVPAASGSASASTSADQLTFTAEVQSPLSAVAVLGAEPWGTRIDWTCTYAGQAGSGAQRSYAMLVTDRTGRNTQVASWMSGPGTTATPTATTSIQRADIAAVSIVSGETGAVLLRSLLHAAG